MELFRIGIQVHYFKNGCLASSDLIDVKVYYKNRIKTDINALLIIQAYQEIIDLFDRLIDNRI